MEREKLYELLLKVWCADVSIMKKEKHMCQCSICDIGGLLFFERFVVAFRSKPDLLLFQGVCPLSSIANLLGAFERKKRRRKKKKKRKTGTPT